MAVTYERVNWVDEPSTDTPLSAENLNKMDEGISELAEWSEDVEESIDDLIERVDGVEDDVSTLNTDIADLKDDLNDLNTSDALKINKPETSPDGTNGQLLRTLGNGKTEWANFAAPTDEQVQASIDAWLDEHPEATTTVEDWSLTENKFVRGALGFITPKMFGAKGDGVTDDTLAFQNAVDYAIQNSVELFVPSGVYIIFPSNGPVYLNHLTADGQGLVMRGAGRGKTIIKEGDGETAKMGRYTKMFYCNLAATSAVSAFGDYIISDITFDKNARSNGTPETLYAWEGAHIIAFQGNAERTINSIKLERLEFVDKIGCGVAIGPSTVRTSLIIIDDVIGTNHPTVASGIIGHKGDIECAIYSDLTAISNCNVKYSQIELTNTYYYSADAYIRYKISDCVFENLEYDAVMVEKPVINVEINNITCTKQLHISGVVAQITNSIFVANNFSVPEMHVDNCIILLTYTETTDESTGTKTLTVNPLYGFMTGTYPDCYYYINNCYFKINSDSVEADVFEGSALKGTNRTVAQTQAHFIVSNCTFDNNICRVVDVFSYGGDFTFENCHFKKRTIQLSGPLFRCGSYSNFVTRLIIKNCDFSTIQNGQIILYVQQSTDNYILEVHGVYDGTVWKQASNNSPNVKTEQYTIHPEIIGEKPTSKGMVHFIGDIILNKVITAEAEYAWICTAGGDPGTWKAIGTISA